ncbi:NACHT domain-containing protein [Rhodococcus opacus]|uniref:hypothetical protein n=1 Tax=Rhodococcus opacus TaxID=37919 RepID=UPI002948D7AA|nr:hypothetical protein [Rhodococcus opacus]MDV6244769.1 hypothetical protein [Rhodococcus opacus]
MGRLTTILRAWTGPKSLLLIDGVDALRGADDRRFLSDTVLSLKDSRWQVVATARTFDARNNQELRQAFPGAPLSDEPTEVDARLQGLRHLLVGDLSDDELDVLASTPLASLVVAATPELRALLRNPFNLRLAAQLSEQLSGDRRAQFREVRSRVGLLELYWQSRVLNEDGTARVALLTRLCEEMASTRRLTVVEHEPVVTAADNDAVAAMLSENVLSSGNGGIPGARRVLSFSHNILFDYAVAIYLLLDPIEPTNLLNKLDADPSLPLVARPSLEMLVDLLWEHRREEAFWPFCLAVAGSDHVLASLTVAARLLNLIGEVDDLTELFPPSGRGARFNGLDPDQEVVRQLVGALRTPVVLPEPGRAVVPLSRLVRRLAENSATSYSDAALAADLLRGLEIRNPVTSGDPGAADRAEAVAALLNGCRTDPEGMEQLAGAAARQLEHVMGISESVAAAVHDLLDDERALRQWGGTVLNWLASAVVPAVKCNPDLGRRIAISILTFDEPRKSQVPLGSSALLPLNQSRRQQAEHSIWVLKQNFAALCTADLVVAAEIFCHLAENAKTPIRPVPENEKWPVRVPGADGWLHDDYGLLRATYDIGETAAQTLSTALSAADPATVDTVVAVLVENLHNAGAWAEILTVHDNALELGRAFLPALSSGALLTHPDTHHAAATLLAAMAAADSSLSDQLEQIVLDANTLADANNLSQRVKDALIGCLNTNAISSPVLADRLAALEPDGPPEILSSRLRITTSTRSSSQFDEFPAQGIDLEEEVESAGRALEKEILSLSCGPDARPEAERRLPELFETADTAFARCEPLPSPLMQLIVRAAAALARDQRVLPETPLGGRVLEILTTAQASSDVGAFLGSDDVWGAGVRDIAVDGLVAFLARDEWRNSVAISMISKMVLNAITDENAVVRMTAAHAAVNLHTDHTLEEIAEYVGKLLLAEEHTAVQIVLLQQLEYVMVGAESTVDTILELLLDDIELQPGTDLGRLIIGVLAHLALVRRTEFASRTTEQWCRSAPQHADEIEVFAQHARDFLGTNGGDARAQAYRLLGAAAQSSHERWNRDPEEHRAATLSEQQRSELEGAAKVAYGIAQQIYFTKGGAYEHEEKQGAPFGPQHTEFATLAFPLLATCASLHVPHCVQEAVKTMIFLAPLDEQRALSSVSKAVPTHGLYASDPLAGDDIIPYLQRLLTEHRQLVLHDPDGTAAFRHLLATFASAGNTEALTLAYTFADVFR